MSHDLVVFGEDWGAHPSSTQHLIRQFLPSRRVIWVNSLGLRAPRLDLTDTGRLMKKFGSLARQIVSPRKRVASDSSAINPHAIIAPAALPFPGNKLAAEVTRHCVSAQISRAMGRIGMDRPVLWTSLPTAEPLLGALDERAIVYYAGDDFGALEGVDHAPVIEMEAKLAARADLVLAASAEIAARFSPGKTMVVPHGVDLDLFSAKTIPPKDMPLDRPIIGFYGNLSGWIDVSLLAETARAFPQARLVLIGPVHADIEILRRFPNVLLLGPKPHHELPGYVQHFDVAILPFRDTPQIRACNPLKLREYMASGASIASTEFPALEPYRALLHVGNGPVAFVEAIKAAMVDRKRADLRRRAVANETWARRAEDVASVIDLL